MNKNIYCIRHGEAVHNVNYRKYGSSTFTDMNYKDTELTELGQYESIVLGNEWKEKHNIELVIVSPLTRALDTCMNIFGGMDVPIFCLESTREYPCGLHTCNIRKDVTILSSKYPRIQFLDFETNHDSMWNPNNKETIESLNHRIEIFKRFVSDRAETNIALVGHNSFISKMKDNRLNYIDNGETELKHCHPYKISL